MTTVKICRWAVLTRDDRSYHRTKAPQEEREEQLIRFVNRGRVKVSWGGTPIVASEDFMLRSGRCIGHPDWVLFESELKDLRKQARAAFPRKKKAKAKDRTGEPPYFPTGELSAADLAHAVELLKDAPLPSVEEPVAPTPPVSDS